MKKGILAALALSLALPACALGEAGYTAGTYSAEAQGMESAVKVTVTVSDSAITDLTIDVSGETAGLGTEVGEPLKAAILEAQSADVDGVAGATVSSTAVKTAVKACLDEASGAAAWDGKFTAGTYTASATGKNGPVTVEVTFSEDAMTDIKVTDHTETYGLGYGVSTAPIDLLPGVILTAQSIDVDSVSSATVTSNAVKEALAKALARSWFGSEKALLKFDMSEYQEQHTTARLLGAPPGYLGHDEGGQLTEAVRRRPYSVVLFDEIEKAHPDIQNILLQILEDGQLTDAMGRKADFRNTIVLLTSNLGARFLAGQNAPLGFAAGSEVLFEKQSAQAIEEAKKWFRPELVGRLDELIVFRPLADESLCAIAEKLLGQLEERAAHNGYQLTHTPRVGPALAARARSPYGARELRRQVDRAVEQALADQIAAGAAHTGQHWTADCTGDGSVVLREGTIEPVGQGIG